MKKKKCKRPKPKTGKKMRVIMPLLFCSLGLAAQDTVYINNDSLMYIINPINPFPEGGIVDWFGYIMETWPNIVALLSSVVAFLEVLLRAVPTNRDYSILTNISRILDNLSFKGVSPFKNRAKNGSFVSKSQKVND